MLSTPPGGVSGPDGNDRHPSVVGHLSEPVPELSRR
jgi:hypothetical protein